MQRSLPWLRGSFGSLGRRGSSLHCAAPVPERGGAPGPRAKPAARRAALPRPGGRRNPQAAAGPGPGGARGTRRPAARPLHKARPCSAASDACPGPRPPGVRSVPRAWPCVPTARGRGRAACRGRRPGGGAMPGLLGPCPGLYTALGRRSQTRVAWPPASGFLELWVMGTRHLRRQWRCPCHGHPRGGRGWGAGYVGAELFCRSISLWAFLGQTPPQRWIRQHAPAHLPSPPIPARCPPPTDHHRERPPFPTPGKLMMGSHPSTALT